MQVSEATVSSDRALVALLVVALVAGGVAAWRLDLVDRTHRRRARRASRRPGPAAVPPPPGLELPALTAPDAGRHAGDPARPDRPGAGRRPRVAPYLADPALGTHVVGAVADLTAGRPVVRVGDGVAAMPASTTKLLTATAALSALGPETRFTHPRGRRWQEAGSCWSAAATRSCASKPLPAGVPRARRHRDAGRRRPRPRCGSRAGPGCALGYDDSLFSEPSFNPAWPAHYLPEHVVSPITALWVDEGRPAGRLRPGRRPVAVRRADVRRRAGRRTASRWSAYPTHGVAVAAGASWRPCSRPRSARSSRGSWR